MQVESTTTGASDWLELGYPGQYRLDLDIPDGLTASVTIEHTNDTANQVKTVKDPDDNSSNWALTASEAMVHSGPSYVRFNCASRSGNTDPIKLIATAIEHE